MMTRSHTVCRGLAFFLAVTLFLGGAAKAADIDSLLNEMSLHEKVCQMFFVQPEQFSRISRVTTASAGLSRAVKRFPVGGVILFPENMKNRESLIRLNACLQEAAVSMHGIGLLIGVDEEGGGVSRLAKKFKLEQKQPAASEIGKTGDAENAVRAGSAIGAYLKEYGFNLDFAPVADVRTDVKRAEIVKRAFSDDPQVVSDMACGFIRGLHSQGVLSAVKHFPGHGAVSGNTHSGPGRSDRTADEWRARDFLPFQAAIAEGADLVMTSHQLAANVDAKNPASLSSVIVTGLLRHELGYDGVVITDALRMTAIRQKYGSGEACVRAIEAGCDMLLLPYNFTNGYRGVMKALASGRISEERINESVRRILALKLRYGLIQENENHQ